LRRVHLDLNKTKEGLTVNNNTPHQSLYFALLLLPVVFLMAAPAWSADQVVSVPTSVTVATAGAGDSVTVTATGSITPPSSGNGIEASQGNHQVTINAGGAVTVDGPPTTFYPAAISTANGGNDISNAGILTAGPTGWAVRGIATLGNDSVTNNGTITTASVLGFAIHTKGGGNTVENQAGGSVTTTGEKATGIRAEGGNNRITNYGTVHTQGFSADAINFSDEDNMLINAGSLITDGDEAYGMIGTVTTVTNSGSIVTNGADAIGILAQIGNTLLTNTGTIHTTGSGDSFAVEIQGSYYGNMVLNNSGLIQADQSYAIMIQQYYGATSATTNLLTGSNLVGGVMAANGTLDLTTQTGATITVFVDGGGVSGIIDITGDAQLNGGRIYADVAGGADVLGKIYTVLLADGGVFGELDEAVSSSALYDVELNHLPNSVTIKFTEPPVAPTVTTAVVTGISETTATAGGEVVDENGDAVNERGVCWSTSPNPTIADNTATSGGGPGAFTCQLTGLSPGTTYYVRAYAMNVMTGYGNEVSFTTAETVIPTLSEWGMILLGVLLLAGAVWRIRGAGLQAKRRAL
jgi:hypothetical protein